MIELNEVELRVHGRALVAEVSATIPAGEVVLLVGPNGAGKSSLARVLLGLARPTAGDVLLDGCSLAGRPPGPARLFGQVGPPALHDWRSARANVRMALGHAGLPAGPADAALARVGLAGRSTRTGRLSMGERQRAALAIALALDPDWLLLDEPTTGLDVQGRQLVVDQLRARRRAGRSSIVATHDLAVLGPVADRALLLVGGRLVEDVDRSNWEAAGLVQHYRQRTGLDVVEVHS